MNRENSFNYNGKAYVFCGFYENKFAFYSDGVCYMVSSIEELPSQPQS